MEGASAFSVTFAACWSASFLLLRFCGSLPPRTIFGFDPDGCRAMGTTFLEGPFNSQPAIATLSWERYSFGEVDAVAERSNRENTDFPLDGILGWHVLSVFDLWFDYDSGVVWVP